LEIILFQKRSLTDKFNETKVKLAEIIAEHPQLEQNNDDNTHSIDEYNSIINLSVQQPTDPV
jgi:hypothetical protein